MCHGVKRQVAVAALALVASIPAFATTEIDALRRELAQQRELIQQLLQAQKKIENQASSAPPAAAGVAPAAKESKVVTFYGVADVGVQNTDTGFGSKLNMGTGGWLASRFGVSIDKPISPDLKAVAVAEAGVHYGTGTVGSGAVIPGINNGFASSGGATSTGSQIFGRQIFAGLKSEKYGALTFGRQYSATFVFNGLSNALTFGGYGYSGAIMAVNGLPTRVNNSMVYVSPDMGGISGQLMYSTGSENNTNGNVPIAPGSKVMTNDDAGRGVELAAKYNKGPVFVGVSAWNFHTTSFASGETGLAKRKGFQLGGAYDFGPVKLFANYSDGRIKGGNYEEVTKAFSKTSAYSLSAMMPFGKHRVYASFTDFSDKSHLNMDAKLYGIGYAYQAEETVKYYFGLGRMDNGANASFSLADGGNLVGTTANPGKSVNGVMAGVTLGF